MKKFMHRLTTLSIFILMNLFFACNSQDNVYAQNCSSTAPVCENRANGACHRGCVAENGGDIGRCQTIQDDPSTCDNEDNNHPDCDEEGAPCDLAKHKSTCQRRPSKRGEHSVLGEIYAIDEGEIATQEESSIPLAKRKIKPLIGATIAWIEDPYLANKSGKYKATRRYTYTESNSTLSTGNKSPRGEYKISDLPEEPLFIGVFCGKEIKVLKGIVWQDETGVITKDVTIPPIYISGATRCTNEQCFCEENDVCMRQLVDKTDYENTCENQINQLDKTPVDYLWRNAIPILNAGFSCLRNPAMCAQALVAYVSGATVTPDDLTTDRAAFVEGTSTALGCDPSAFTKDGLAPSCDDIRDINARFRGMNQGACGGGLIKTSNPEELKKQVLQLYSENPDICYDNSGAKVSARNFRPPMYIAQQELSFEFNETSFEPEFFPYYRLKDIDPDRAELTPSIAGEGVDPNGSCSGYGCSPGSGIDEYRHITSVNLRGGSFSPVSTITNMTKIASTVTTPDSEVQTKQKPKGNVYNVHLFGQECECTGGKDSDGRCLEGGFTASFSQFIDIINCQSDPQAPGCSTQKAFNSMANVKLPRAKELGAVSGVLCDSLSSPITPLQSIGGIGTTTTKANIRNSDVPTPYGVEGLGTVTAAKECISRLSSFPIETPKE